jgi:alpha-L-fucosidase
MDGGNLLLSIGPKPDGSAPPGAIEPLTTIGKRLTENAQAIYGHKLRTKYVNFNGICGSSFDGAKIYVWN